MVWHSLLQLTNAPLLALTPSTVDRIVVWGALALMIGLIAWREYTLPEVSTSLPSPKAAGVQDTRGIPDPGSRGPLLTSPEAQQPGGPLVVASDTPGPQEQEGRAGG